MLPSQTFHNFVNTSFDSNINLIVDKLLPNSDSTVENLFPTERVFEKNCPLEKDTYTRYTSNPLARQIARGLTSPEQVAAGTTETLDYYIVKFGAKHILSDEDMQHILDIRQKYPKLDFNGLFNKANRQNPTELFDALRNSIEVNCFFGIEGHNKIATSVTIDTNNDKKTKGLFNETPHYVQATGNGSTDQEKRLWTNKTPQQKFDDIITAYKAILDDTIVADMSGGFVLLMPLNDYVDFQTQTVSVGVTATPLLDRLKAFGITPIAHKFMSPNPIVNERRFVLYKKNPSILTHKTSIQPYYESSLAPIDNGMQFGYHVYDAGVFVMRPNGVYVGRGI